MTSLSPAVRSSSPLLLLLLLFLQPSPAPARGLRTSGPVREEQIQRLLHGVMEQLGIARPREEFTAHQKTNVEGPMSIQGGAHEGLQHLGPYGNIPNFVAELTGDPDPPNRNQNAAQGYPHPPNPCPTGKTESDGCLSNVPDSADFSRSFQQNQNLYDPEHDYKERRTWNKDHLYQQLEGGARRRRRRSVNPYLQGQRLDNVVAKKSVPHFSEEEEEEVKKEVKREVQEEEEVQKEESSAVESLV